MRYFIDFIDPTGNLTALTPSIVLFVKASDGTSAGAAPAISHVGSGVYSFDFVPTEKVVYKVDGGEAIGSPLLRYKSGTLGPQDEKVVITESPTGVHLTAFTTRDDTDTIIPNVKVAILNSQNQIQRNFTTTANGESNVDDPIRLDSGTYKAISHCPGYQIPDKSFTVVGPGLVAITGSRFNELVPPSGSQTLSIYPVDPAFLFDPTCTVTVEASSPGHAFGSFIPTPSKMTAFRNNDHLEVIVKYGASYKVEGYIGSVCFLRKTITVTNVQFANLNEYV